MTEASRIHTGHRQRMRDKLITHGSRVLQSYELLEMLLYHVMPHKDTNPIAKRLFLKFGSINGVFSANKDELMTVEGVGEGIAEYLIKAGKIILDPFCDASDEAYDDYDKIGGFLTEKLSSFDSAKTVAVVFDNRMRMIAYRELYDLDYSSGAVRADSFVDFAIKNNAAVVVTAHNHPHGPFFPTIGDMATNTLIGSALHSVGVELIEHYIVSGSRYIGIMKRLSLAFKQTPELERFYESREASLNE